MENSSNDKGLGLPATPSGSPLQVLAEDGSGLSASIPKPPAHTPGPWFIKEGPAYGLDVRLKVEAGADAKRKYGMVICERGVTKLDTDIDAENRANMRLIAAAPDLLEALRELVDDVCYQNQGIRPPSQYETTAMIAARAAIAKATSNP